jgi:two-component system response regulator GlrR
MIDDRQPLILVVDDDYDFLELNRMILEKADYRVMTAAEPNEALRKMEVEKPDLIITDLMMTSLDSGFSFSGGVKHDPRYAGTPIIMSTSVSSALGLDFRPQTTDELAEMHVDAYFDKPLDPTRLLAKVGELLAKSGRVAKGGGVARVGGSAGGAAGPAQDGAAGRDR